MANKFEIIGIALVVTDTVSGIEILDMPSNSVYYNYEELRRNARIKIYDTNDTNFRSAGVLESLLANSTDSLDAVFTESSFLEFARKNLASNISSPAESEFNVFQFGDGSDHDATVDETSSAIDTPNNFGWNVAPTSTGVSGVAQYTVEVSQDGVTWFDYAVIFTNVANVDAVEDPFLTWEKMRINHKAGSSTAGTVKYTLTQID